MKTRKLTKGEKRVLKRVRSVRKNKDAGLAIKVLETFAFVMSYGCLDARTREIEERLRIVERELKLRRKTKKKIKSKR